MVTVGVGTVKQILNHLVKIYTAPICIINDHNNCTR